ncbi:hypothetical protein [Vibrio crassostreae]|uniref:DUF7768 domain-containing protein n=1 Tax=Vibrio crassostreae TaxID=246167 RepID=UPI001B3064D2|nr:hypothetical protein [Vibrio crassostreae]
MKVIVESPFKNKDENLRNENLIYLNVVFRRLAIKEGKSPLAFHSLYTQFLDDNDDFERKLGLDLSFTHHPDSECKLVAIDRGMSHGIALGIIDAIEKDMPVYYFTLCSEETEVAQRIKEINEIEDNKERSNVAMDYIASLGSIGALNDFGDFTDYREYCVEETETVKKVINKFFAPLVEYINE